MGYPTDQEFAEARQRSAPPRPRPRTPAEIRQRVREGVAEALFKFVPEIDPHDDEAWVVDAMMKAFDTALLGHVILKA